MAELLNAGPLYRPQARFGTQATSDKGKQIMEGLLLNQYQNSPLLQEYMMCFIAELDLLFEQTEEVYLGRFIESAVGRQLDIIGIILQLPRSIVLPTQWFGFQGAVDVAGMADETSPANGGIFRDANVGDGELTPLDDSTYRRLLLAKAFIINRDSADTGLAYFVVSTLLGRVPSLFELRDADSVTEKILNGNFDTDLDNWVEGTTGTGATLTWLPTGKMEVIPPLGENGYAEQVINVHTGQRLNLKLDWDNEAGSECRILVGTAVEVNRYYTNFGQGGSGSLNIETSVIDLDEPVHIRIGSIEQNTWSTFDNVSVTSVLPPKRSVELIMSAKDVSVREESIINYMAKYFVPAGISFETTRI